MQVILGRKECEQKCFALRIAQYSKTMRASSGSAKMHQARPYFFDASTTQMSSMWAGKYVR